MRQPSKRWKRWIAPVLLGLGLSLNPAISPPARAQEEVPNAEEGAGSGRPLDGYLATITLMLLALFVVGKSARR